MPFFVVWTYSQTDSLAGKSLSKSDNSKQFLCHFQLIVTGLTIVNFQVLQTWHFFSAQARVLETFRSLTVKKRVIVLPIPPGYGGVLLLRDNNTNMA